MPPDAVLREVESFATLASVIPWAYAQTPPAEFLDVISQDEFTQDVVVSVAPGVFLVFDTT